MKEDDYVLVKRRHDVTMKLVTHGRITPDEATEEYIQGRWGGGEYQLQERKATTEGRHTYGTTKTVHIAGPYKGASPLPSGDEAPAAVVGTIPPGVSPGEALNTALVSQVIEFLKVARETPKGPSIDWGIIIPAVTGLLTPIITALLQRPKNDDTAKLLQSFERMAELFKASTTPLTPGQAAGNSLKEMLDLVQSVVDVRNELSSGGESKPSPEMMMLSYVPELIKALTGQRTQPDGAPAGATTTAVAPGQPSTVDTSGMPAWQQVLLANKKQMLHMAATDVDPEFAAEMAVNLMPPNYVGIIREFLALPDHVQQAMGAVPELRNFPTWANKFFAAATSLMSDDGEEHPDGPQP